MDVETETFATYAFQNMDTGVTSEVVDEDEGDDEYVARFAGLDALRAHR